MNHTFDDRQLATILAALRYWKRSIVIPAKYWMIQGLGADEEYKIATNGGVEPLTAIEIDDLCKRLSRETSS